MKAAGLVLVLLTSCASPTPAAPERPDPARPDPPSDRDYSALASNDLDTRERAEQEALKEGQAAIPALRRAAESSDPELRARAQALLDRLLGGGPLPPDVRDALVAATHRSPWVWEKLKIDEAVDRGMRAAPKTLLAFLIDALADERPVSGELEESQIYSVNGLAARLLKKITSRVFHTADGKAPSVRAAWKAWLDGLHDRPAEAIFEGLSWAESRDLETLFKLPISSWHLSGFTKVAGLVEVGRRLVPYLLLRIRDQEFTFWSDREKCRQCDAANALLRTVTQQDFGNMERYDPLEYDPKDPMRANADRLTRESVASVAMKWEDWWARNR